MSELVPVALNFRLLSRLQEGSVQMTVPIVQLPSSQEYAVALGLRDQEYEACRGRDGLNVEVSPNTIFITRASGRNIQIMDLISRIPGPVLEDPVPALLLERQGQRWATTESFLPDRLPAFLFFIGQLASVAYAKQTWVPKPE